MINTQEDTPAKPVVKEKIEGTPQTFTSKTFIDFVRHHIWLTVFVCGLLVWLVVWLSFFNAPKEVAYVTDVVIVADLEKTVLATGKLVPYLQVNVGLRASGQVTSLLVDVGDKVTKGDIIAIIDSARQENDLETALAARADIMANRQSGLARLEQAQNNMIRQNSLFKADAGSKIDQESALAAYRAAKNSLDSLNAQVVQANINVKTARVTLGYTKIQAPISGTVLSVDAKEGQTLNALQSAPTIVTLGQLDRITVKVEIAEADVIKVMPNMRVYFTILGDPDHRYYANLRRLEPAPTNFSASTNLINSVTAIYYYGLFDIDNSDGRLMTSMTANVSIVLSSAPKALSMNASALGKHNKDGSYDVLVLDRDNETRTVKTKIGIGDGTNVEIISGLKAGDRVIIPSLTTSEASTSSSSSKSNRPRTRQQSGTLGGL